MLDQHHFDQISQALPFLKTGPPELIRDFTDMAYYANISSGKEIFVEGDEVNGIALIISGVVRVYKVSESGREITLYRFGVGESCVITANAILHQQDFPAIAVVEKDAEAVMIPADSFNQWVRKYDAWRDFVFKLVSQRLANVMEIVEEVAFKRLDNRLAAILLSRAQSGSTIKITHQEIANEVGSSREVISRLLDDFVKREIIKTSRGAIQVLDTEALNTYLT
jgi:CRP/FNR family transcriptional regulator